MKRPSFQFYPGDWRANSNLRRCSWSARGVWLEVMCLMHDSERYGVLAWSLKEIAQALGCGAAPLNELVAKGVLKGCDGGECGPYIYTPRSGRKDGDPVELVPAQAGPIWYSSRMVRDNYVRENAGSGSRFHSPSSSPSRRHGEDQSEGRSEAPSRRLGEDQSDGSSSSSSSSIKIPIPSEAKASGEKSPPKASPPNAKDTIFGYGVPLLVESGMQEVKARRFLGGLCKRAGDDAVANAISRCIAEHPVEPVAWLSAAVPPVAPPAATAPSRGSDTPDILADPHPQWALDAGFASRFEAENADCFRRNAAQFRNGKRIPVEAPR